MLTQHPLQSICICIKIKYDVDVIQLFYLWGGQKKINHKSEEKMHFKVKMTSQRAENLVNVQQHHSKHFSQKTFF